MLSYLSLIVQIGAVVTGGISARSWLKSSSMPAITSGAHFDAPPGQRERELKTAAKANREGALFAGYCVGLQSISVFLAILEGWLPS